MFTLSFLHGARMSGKNINFDEKNQQEYFLLKQKTI